MFFPPLGKKRQVLPPLPPDNLPERKANVTMLPVPHVVPQGRNYDHSSVGNVALSKLLSMGFFVLFCLVFFISRERGF